MKKVFASSDVSLVSLYQAMLEDNDIPTIIKNYYLTSGVGDLPANECVPELWIIQDEQLDEARNLLSVEKSNSWVCKCGEKITGQFAQCWKCGNLRD